MQRSERTQEDSAARQGIAQIFPPDRVSVSALARELDVDIATIWRWRTKGLHGHRLETLNIGGKVYVSLEALARWKAATSSSPSAGPPTTPPASERERRRGKAVARATIASDGIDIDHPRQHRSTATAGRAR
jgi:hypothetical protein